MRARPSEIEWPREAVELDGHAVDLGSHAVGGRLLLGGSPAVEVDDVVEIGRAHPHVLELKLWVNGKQMQSGNTKTFIFDVRYLVSYLSRLMTLAPGDLIATGTPPGVGLGKKPPVFLEPGDVVTMEITGLGRLENPVKEA